MVVAYLYYPFLIRLSESEEAGDFLAQMLITIF
jgi:hypothetical protein